MKQKNQKKTYSTNTSLACIIYNTFKNYDKGKTKAIESFCHANKKRGKR